MVVLAVYRYTLLSMSSYLTKSGFKAACSCPSKLYYYHHGYPSNLNKDEYLKLLSDGGYVVGKLAQILYPAGFEITGPLDDAVRKTAEELNCENVTLFEPAILSDQMLVRVDILEKSGQVIRIIEVKSKSFDSSKYCNEGTGYFKKKARGWDEHFEDIAFQKFVVSRAYPDAAIETYLLLPDKGKRNEIEGLFGWFSVSDNIADSAYAPPSVTFTGDVDTLIRDNFMALIDVSLLVEEQTQKIENEIPRYLESIARNERIIEQISVRCAKCEYRDTNAAHPRSGFEICWADMANTKPHILELGRLGNFNRNGQVDELISHGKSSLHDVPAGLVEGQFNNRSFYQVTRQKETLELEFIPEVVEKLQYPLHFIDFETAQSAVPFYRGMHPYDNVLFQWSCQTMRSPGAVLEHGEWLHDDQTYPNVTFGKTLMDCLGDTGTIMTWSPYENTQLAYLYRYLSDNNINETGLSGWLERTARIDGQGGERIVDLNKVALKYYFHPLMGAKTSIKVTLPSILSSAASSHRIQELLQADDLYQLDQNGSIIDPYSLLPAVQLLERAGEPEKSERVAEGTGAMIAYQKMMYGGLAIDERQMYREALLRYCNLDTLAMVLIWEYWDRWGK
jgi:hypothetical protein